MHYTRNMKRAGRALLKKLLPEARRMLDERKAEGKDEILLRATSEIAKVAASFHHRNSMDSVCVYQGEKGGWIADLLFKNVPRGLGDINGTPVGEPHATRNEAIAAVTELVSAYLTRDPPTDSAVPDPVFELFDMVIVVRRSDIERFEREHSDFEGFEESKVVTLLNDIEDRFVQDNKMFDKLQSMSDVDRRRINGAAFMAIHLGMSRWPPRRAGMAMQSAATH
jgi:hypothetical protein